MTEEGDAPAGRAAGGFRARPPRAQLAVPGNRPERMAKAASCGADLIALDLQDSVPPAEHEAARAHVAEYLAGLPADPGTVQVSVRVVDARHRDFEGDLDAVVRPGLSAVALPDVTDPEEVRRADALLGELEAARGLPVGSVRLLPSAESARGLRRLHDILTASPRVAGIDFPGADGGDLVRDLGVTWTREGAELLFVRSLVVFEARAAGIASILDAVYVDLADDEGFAADTAAGKRMGYTGRTAVHPGQVELINRIYTPSEAEVEAAHELLAAFRAAEREGRGAIRHRGRLVDQAMVRSAEQLLARAGAA